jgi:hypothetical protein
MTVSRRPYALPRKLEPGLARVLAYWQGLKRGEAEMPFADDVSLSALAKLAARLMLIEVLGKPVRLRCGFGVVGADIKRQYGGDLDGKFLDEIEPRHPLQFFQSQTSATIESGAPTHYQHAGAKGSEGRAQPGYARLLLPMWRDDHIGMLLGAFVWLRSR